MIAGGVIAGGVISGGVISGVAPAGGLLRVAHAVTSMKDVTMSTLHR
jgi:hypothetical protein